MATRAVKQKKIQTAFTKLGLPCLDESTISFLTDWVLRELECDRLKTADDVFDVIGDILISYDACESEEDAKDASHRLFLLFYDAGLFVSATRASKGKGVSRSRTPSPSSRAAEAKASKRAVGKDGVFPEGSVCLAMSAWDGEWYEAQVLSVIREPEGPSASSASSASSSPSSSSVLDSIRYRVFFKRLREEEEVEGWMVKQRPADHKDRDSSIAEEEAAGETNEGLDEEGGVDWKDLSPRTRARLSELAAAERAASRAPPECPICERVMPLTRHHLIPRTMHDKYLKLGKTQKELNTCVDICRPCHSAVHRLYEEPVLAAQYYTLDLLLADERVQKWAHYAGKQKARDLSIGHNPAFRYRR